LAKKIVVPIVGEKGQKYDIVSMVEWKAGEGEKVDKGAVVLYMETEKASCDVEANSAGFIHILTEAGGKAMVGATVGLIAETEEELAKLKAVPPEKLAKQIEAKGDGEDFILD
jgi:pyruvate/2-oxoglutarate dehydrogenase complex dihydrolipoamide acyltransferase (E2) component